MKTLVIGAGAIGTTVAVLTKEAGYDISILCRSEETQRIISKKGLTLKGAKGEHTVHFTCYKSIKEIGDNKFDICFIATKYAGMAKAATDILPCLKENSLVVGMQNGICTSELAGIVGNDRSVGCMLGYGATRLSATEVDMTSLGEMYIGMPGGLHPGTLDYLKSMLDCIVPTKISDDITRQQYSKLIINSCINATSAITGKTLGEVIGDIRARKLFLAIAREGMHVAKAMKIDVPKYGKMLEYKALMIMDNAVYNSLCRYVVWLVAKLKYANVKPSTLQSLERGEKTEIDIFNGYFAEKGDEYGVPTPVNHKLTEMIHEIERGERKITSDNLEEFRGVIF